MILIIDGTEIKQINMSNICLIKRIHIVINVDVVVKKKILVAARSRVD